METFNQVPLTINVTAVTKGEPPVYGGAVLFPVDVHDVITDCPNLFAARLYQSDFTEDAGDLSYTIGGSRQDLNTNLFFVGKPDLSGNPLSDVINVRMLYVRSPIRMSVAYSASDPAALTDWSPQKVNGLLLVKADDDNLIDGMTLTCLASEADSDFFVDVIFAASKA